MSKNTTAVTPVFTANFPQLLSPKKNDLNGRDEYSVVALFPKGEDTKALEEICKNAIEKKWPDANSRPKGLKSPFRKQEEKAKDVDGKRVLPPGHVEGAVFCTFKCKDRPGVVNSHKQPILDASELYSGMKGVCQVTAHAYDHKGNRGVSLYLNHFMKWADGDSLSGRVTAESAFASIAPPAEEQSAPSDMFG